MSEKEQDPIVIDEVVTFDPEVADIKSPRAEFATVVFHNIAETYPEDAHIECRYTVTADLVPTSRDYVALFKVGWMSPKDYIYYEWAPIPKNYTVGCEADSSVLFPAHKLPKDDGEFYQFCYVSSSNQIRGASTPFQFRRPGADDFVEVEDEETNMLVIRSKTLYLEENLQMAQSQKQKLLETQEALQKERDSIITKYQEVKNKLVTMETENATLKGKTSSSERAIEQLKREARDMLTLTEELQEKIVKLNEGRVTLNEQIKSLTSDLTVAKATIARMTADLEAKKKEINELYAEKDELSGKNAILQDQAEMLKKHAETTEGTVDQYSKQSEALQMKFAQQESLIDHLKHNVETLSAELEDNRLNLDKQTAVSIQDKEKIQNLEEQLKNTEDKLMAAEESKVILQKEITTFEVTQHEMSRQIEKSKSECESLKKKLVTLEEDFTQKTQIQAMEMEQTQNDVLAAIQEKEKLQKENSQLKHRISLTLQRSDMSHGSMSIMKQSLDQIKERLEKKEKQYRSLEKVMRDREQDKIEHEREMRREIEDLKEKIYMCGEEYKVLYLEKNKLQRKVQKMGSRRKSKSEKHEKQPAPEPMIEAAEAQQSAAVSEVESEVSTAQDLVSEVDDLEKALDRKILKKEKYKKLYAEESKKNESLKKMHAEVLAEKEAEIARLKKRIRELPNDWDLKLRALEKCVTEKEMTIEELNQKLRLSNQGRNDETGASMLPRGPSSPPQGFRYMGEYQPVPSRQAAYPPWVQVYPQGPIQYPNSQQYPSVGPVPIVYPYPMQGPQQEGPPVPPRIRFPARTAETLDQTGAGEDVSVLDSPEESSSLEVPLKPLPPPLAPEVLPTAKVAAVRKSAGLDEPDGKFADAFCSETDLKVKLPNETCVLDFVVPEREDRFYDAEGSSMNICPECDKAFPADADEQVLLEHQLSHMGTICPLCKVLKPDNMTDDDFARHVNNHYDEEKCEVY